MLFRSLDHVPDWGSLGVAAVVVFMSQFFPPEFDETFLLDLLYVFVRVIVLLERVFPNGFLVFLPAGVSGEAVRALLEPLHGFGLAEDGFCFAFCAGMAMRELREVLFQRGQLEMNSIPLPERHSNPLLLLSVAIARPSGQASRK